MAFSARRLAPPGVWQAFEQALLTWAASRGVSSVVPRHRFWRCHGLWCGGFDWRLHSSSRAAPLGLLRGVGDFLSMALVVDVVFCWTQDVDHVLCLHHGGIKFVRAEWA